MSNIEVSASLWLLENVPLDRDYKHTYLFPNPTTQLNILAGYRNGSPREMTYIRQTRRIRFAGLSDNYQGVNYIIFTNGDRHYFAFVNQIEYVNDGVSEIDFTIDIMQTYMFDYELGECLVEREHTATDNFGEHTIPEEFSDLHVSPKNVKYVKFESGTITGYAIIKVFADKNFSVSSEGEYINSAQVVNEVGLPYISIAVPIRRSTQTQDFEQVLTLINTLPLANVSVMDFVIVPALALNYNTATNKANFERNSGGGIINFSNAFDGYTPKNMKLYNSPYTNITISGDTGKTYKTVDVCSGLFNGELSMGYAYGIVSQPECKAMIMPTKYPADSGMDYGVPLELSIRTPWSIDSFNTWWSNNGLTTIANAWYSTIGGLQNLGAAVGMGMTGSVAGVMAYGSAASNQLNTPALTAVKFIEEANRPPDTYGGVSGAWFKKAFDYLGYSVTLSTIRANEAKAIDDYFTVYGYKVNKLKIPNRYNRTKCTFIKTNGCVVHPIGRGMNAIAEQTIANIYDRGITFWQPNTTIGDYSGNEVKNVN